MKSRLEARHICADVLLELRTKAGLSKAKMADLLCITERTYTRYESGESSPPLEDFLAMLEAVDAPALPTVLRHLYPESYDERTLISSTADARQTLARYVLKDAGDRDARQLLYLLNGAHGSSQQAQLQMFCAIDHLPMDVRLMIAKLTINAWEIAQARGEILNPENVMPDIELLRQAIIRAQEAVVAGRNHYANITK